MFIKNNIVFSEKLSIYKEIIHGISTRELGNQSFLNRKFSEEETINNRKKFLVKLGINLNRIVNAFLVHSSHIYDVKECDAGKGAYNRKTLIHATDGLITNIPDVFLMVTVADCLPMLFYEPKQKVAAIIHAGWQGTAKMIAQKTVAKMVQDYDCRTKEIIVFIGPSIGPCHYNVSEKKASKFNKRYLIYKHNEIYVDLWQANKRQLLENGIEKKNIELSNECTACHLDKYSSYHLEKEGNYISITAVIGLRK